MTRWHALEPADAGFLSSAPHVWRYRKHFDASPERVWESLTSDESLAAWGKSISEITWLTPRPFAVGTTREVLAPGGVRVRERFFRWEEGKRYSFEVYEATAPIFRRFAEDYAISPEGGGTAFDWTVAVEAKGLAVLPFKVFGPLVKAGFGRIAGDGQRYFAKRA
jgi:polyketide cyclase/dehydrase/lipid transport protein